jgi:hypothetical protein
VDVGSNGRLPLAASELRAEIEELRAALNAARAALIA